MHPQLLNKINRTKGKDIQQIVDLFLTFCEHIESYEQFEQD